MEWDTDQYAILFKVIARKFWDEADRIGAAPTRPGSYKSRKLQEIPRLQAWDKYLEELGIHNSALSGSPSWEELCGRPDIMKINILYDNQVKHAVKGLSVGDGSLPECIRVYSEASRIHKIVFAAQDQENVFVTDPSLSTEYRHFEDWSVNASVLRPEISSVLDLVGEGYRSEQKGGELLTVPKRAAENILVLGLP